MESIIDTLITDRTQADVERTRYLKSLWDARARRWTGTQAEWGEWNAGPRGAYCFVDMNRVEEAVAYLIGRLSEAGYTVADAGSVVPAFNIRVSVNPENGGEAQGGGILCQGETATVTANPSAKHDFVGWMENGVVVSTQPVYTFAVERSRNLTAVFALKKYTVSASVNPAGSGEVSGAGVYDVGTVVTVSARAGEGYAFTRWTRDGEDVGTGPEYSFTLERDTSLSAVMTKLHVISVDAGEDGGGTVSGGGTCLDGQTVTVAAVAGDGYAFAGWMENGKTVSTDEVYTFTANADRTLTAAFVRLYTVTLLVEPDGSGEASGAGVYRAGERVTVSAAPEDGQRFVEWIENGQSANTAAEYAFIVNGDTTLTARFEEIPVYTICVGVLPEQEELGAVTGAGSYREGTVVTVKAEAADGYMFSTWYEDGEIVSEDAEYTFTVTGPRTLEAAFKKFSRLPNGYIEVEYIQSTAPAYINTGIKPTNTIKLVIDIEFTNPASSSLQYIAYSYYKASTLNYIFDLNWGAKGVRVTIGSYGSSSAALTKVLTPSTEMKRWTITIDCPNKNAFVDGEEKIPLLGTSASTNMPAINLLRGINSDTYALPAKVYSCQIYRDNAIVRDFVPCIDPSRTVGLYDLAEGKFYANSGTGTLTAGPEA